MSGHWKNSKGIWVRLPSEREMEPDSVEPEIDYAWFVKLTERERCERVKTFFADDPWERVEGVPFKVRTQDYSSYRPKEVVETRVQFVKVIRGRTTPSKEDLLTYGYRSNMVIATEPV